MTASRFLPFLMSLFIAGAASAAPLTITNSYSVTSDSYNLLTPKAIPGAIIDYDIVVNNPNIYVTKSIVVMDRINTSAAISGVEYYVGPSAAPHPFTFYEGGLLGILGASGLGYTVGAFTSTADSVAYSSDYGVSYNYTPAPDAAGYDRNVTNIRVTFNNNFNVGGTFALRFRVRVKS